MAHPREGRHAKAFNRLDLKFRAGRVARACSICVFLLAIYQSVSGMPQADVPADAAGEFNRALDHFRAGSYAEALRVIEPLGSLHPEVAEVQHLLAIILDLNSRPEEANQHFWRAVELEPESVVLRTNLGASLMRLGRASEAASQFREALKSEPNHPTASFNLGTILLQQGDPEKALPWLENAFAAQSGVYQNAYQLAYCRFLLGRYGEVEEVVEGFTGPATSRVEVRLLRALTERALGRADRIQEVLRDIQPLLAGQPQVQFQVAMLLLSQDLFEPSAELLHSVAREIPGSYPAHFNLALAQKELAQFTEATETARAALALEETAEIHLLLADLMEAQEEPVEAVEHFQRAVALDPTPANYFALGYEFLIHWNWEAAAQVFSTGLEREPDSWHLWIGSGAAGLGLTRYEEATQAFLNAVELEPRELTGYHLLAQSFDKSEEGFDDAVQAFRGLLERDPANPWARYFEALAAFREGSRSDDSSQMAAGVESLGHLTRENSDFLEALLLLSEIQFELQNWAETVEALEIAVQLDPDHVSAHYRLGLALQRSGQSERAQQTLRRYQALKSREDQTVGERVAVTTRFIVGLKQNAKLR